MRLWLIDPRTRERVSRLSWRASAALRAYKTRRADSEQAELSRALLDRAHERGLWFECGCRRVGSQYPDFYSRRQRNGEYSLANRTTATVAHAEDCAFRRGDADADRPPPGRHPDVLDAFGAADDDRPGPAPNARPNAYWKPPALPAAEMTKTLWGAASKLMQTARLNLLGTAGRYRTPEAWLAEIARAAEKLYLPPRVPASRFLFTDPAAWRTGEVAARLEAAAPGWPARGCPGALLCWPITEVSGCHVDPGEPGHVEALSKVVCPTIHGRPVAGPWLFAGAVARKDNRWACVEACARPIAGLDFSVPVDSDYERQAAGALARMAQTLAGNPALAARIGGAPRIEIEKPLSPIRTAAGDCLPDFLLTADRPGAHGHGPGGPGDPRHFGRFDPRDRARYVIEVMGFADADYEAKKRRTHPRMAKLGPVLRMEGREFGPGGAGIGRERERIAAEIARDLIRRWRTGRRPAPAGSEAA